MIKLTPKLIVLATVLVLSAALFGGWKWHTPAPNVSPSAVSATHDVQPLGWTWEQAQPLGWTWE